MIYLKEIYKKLMGSDGKTSKLIESRSNEADAIKTAMNKDIAKAKKKIDDLNVQSLDVLKDITSTLKSTTYHIAVATGGKKRGLK